MKHVRILILLLFVACTEEKEVLLPGDYPVVFTAGYTNLNDKGITLQGVFHRPGDQEILSYGFEWESQLYKYTESLEGSVTESFQYRVTADLENNQRYLFRAFAKTAKRTYYGVQMEFYGQGALPPIITGFGAMTGVPGTQLTINVENISKLGFRNKVEFNGEEADIIQVFPESIHIIIPENTVSGPAAIQVISGNEKSAVNSEFIVEGPTISSVSTTELFPGELIYIYGQNFMKEGLQPQVKIGENVLAVIEASDTEIFAKVPSDALKGPNYIQVVSQGVQSARRSLVTIKDPWDLISVMNVENVESSFFFNEKIYVLNKGVLYETDPQTGISLQFLKDNLFSFPLGSCYVGYNNIVYQIGGTINGEWTKTSLHIDMESRIRSYHTTVPFDTENLKTFTRGKNAYFITRFAALWKLDMETGTLQQMSNCPDPAMNGFFTYEMNGQTYMATDEGVFIYDELNDNWQITTFEGDTSGFNSSGIMDGFLANGRLFVIDTRGDLFGYNLTYQEWINHGRLPVFTDEVLIFKDNGQVRLQIRLGLYTFQMD